MMDTEPALRKRIAAEAGAGFDHDGMESRRG